MKHSAAASTELSREEAGAHLQGRSNPMRSRKLWALLAVLALAGSVIVGSVANAAPQTTRSSKAVTLVWWHNATQGEGLKLWKNVATEFHKLHPDVTVKVVPLQNEQFTTKIPIALQSNHPPDVFQNWGGGQLVDQVKAH